MNLYQDFLTRTGLDEDKIAILMHDNLILDCIHNRAKLDLRRSSIQGIGVFAKEKLCKGESWTGMLGATKYLCGRFINHSDDPNCEFLDIPNGVACQTIKDIISGEELTVNYMANLNLAFHKTKPWEMIKISATTLMQQAFSLCSENRDIQ